MKQLLIFCLCLFHPITANASDIKTILVYSEDLQQSFLLKTVDHTSIEVLALDKSVDLKASCGSNKPVRLDSLMSSRTCFIESIENNFNISIDNYIDLDLDAIDQDYELSNRASDLETFDDIQMYFEELGDSINFSVIWRFNEYMNTDLDITELFDFYNVYASDSLSITYYYPFLIQIGHHWIPLDKTFYKSQH